MTEENTAKEWNLTPPPNIRCAKCCKFCKHWTSKGFQSWVSVCGKYPDGPYMVYPTSLCDEFEDVEIIDE